MYFNILYRIYIYMYIVVGFCFRILFSLCDFENNYNSTEKFACDQ